MKINTTHGILDIPNYVVNPVYHSKEIDKNLHEPKKYEMDRKKADKIVGKQDFSKTLQSEINSMKKR